MKWLPMFVPGHEQPTPLWCALCGKRFRRWNGTANHGLMHQEALKGVVGAVKVELQATAQGYRYTFWYRA